MSELQKLSSWFVLLLMVYIGSMIYLEVSRGERMAKAGYMPYRLAGDVTVYWTEVPTSHPKDGVNKF